MLVSGNAILYSGDNGKRRTAGCPRLPSLRGGAGPQKARQGQFHGDKEEKGDTFEEGTHLNPLRGPMHGTADGGAGSSRERDTKRAGAGHGDCGRAGRWRRHARDESGRGRPADRQSAGSLGRLEQGLHSGDHRGPRRHPEIRLQSGGAHRRRRGGLTQTLSAPAQGTYVLSGWSKAQNVIRGVGTEYFSYCLAVYVGYTDGTASGSTPGFPWAPTIGSSGTPPLPCKSPPKA